MTIESIPDPRVEKEEHYYNAVTTKLPVARAAAAPARRRDDRCRSSRSAAAQGPRQLRGDPPDGELAGDQVRGERRRWCRRRVIRPEPAVTASRTVAFGTIAGWRRRGWPPPADRRQTAARSPSGALVVVAVVIGEATADVVDSGAGRRGHCEDLCRRAHPIIEESTTLVATTHPERAEATSADRSPSSERSVVLSPEPRRAWSNWRRWASGRRGPGPRLSPTCWREGPTAASGYRRYRARDRSSQQVGQGGGDRRGGRRS